MVEPYSENKYYDEGMLCNFESQEKNNITNIRTRNNIQPITPELMSPKKADILPNNDDPLFSPTESLKLEMIDLNLPD